jgi:ribonuclease G
VLGEFRKQLARDRTKITVSGFTQLGLVEMTRKRTRESLAHMLCEPCPTCAGQGPGQDAAQRLLRHPARDPARGAPVQPEGIPRHRGAAVVEMLLDEESQHLVALSEFIGKPISLQAEATGSPEAYDIVLM